MAFHAWILALGFAVSMLSGFLGIGGGILMAPALLYLPPLLGVGHLEMREVAGLTIAQGLFACLAGAVSHDRYRTVNRRLVAWMGGSMLLGSLAGSLASLRVPNETLMGVFAVLAFLAAVLMWMPLRDRDEVGDAGNHMCNVPAAVAVALPLGLLCGMIGQGGSFILIPLMIHVLGVPTRVAIGSNMAVVLLSSLAGFTGKVATGQVPLVPAALLVAGALPGAAVGSSLSHRTPPRWLRAGLATVIGVAALRMAAGVLWPAAAGGAGRP